MIHINVMTKAIQQRLYQCRFKERHPERWAQQKTKAYQKWSKNNPDKVKAHGLRSRNKWVKKHPERAKASRRRYVLGKGAPEHLAAQIKEQNNCCAVCGMAFIKEPHLDHDHKTSFLRGALCQDCNLGLGRFKDSIGILNNAISYLIKWGHK